MKVLEAIASSDGVTPLAVAAGVAAEASEVGGALGRIEGEIASINLVDTAVTMLAVRCLY